MTTQEKGVKREQKIKIQTDTNLPGFGKIFFPVPFPWLTQLSKKL